MILQCKDDKCPCNDITLYHLTEKEMKQICIRSSSIIDRVLLYVGDLT